MPNPTIWAREPHTEVKHNIYDGYLDAWFPIILRGFGSATYAEGYAGPGVYLDDKPGSPLRALDRLRNVRRQHGSQVATAPVRFVLIDKRRDRVDSLRRQFEAALGAALPGGWYHDQQLTVLIRRGDCEQDLPEALAEVGAWNSPILAVLDSFGGGCSRELLTLLAQNRAGEVLTTVEPQHFVRELDPERADRVFGTTTWRDVDRQPAERKRTFIVEQLDAATRDAGFRHVVRFGLHTNTGGELVLQFGTNNVRGLERFKDSLWNADPVAGAGFRDPNDPDQMTLDMQLEPNLGPLRRILHGHLSDLPARTATLNQLRQFTLEHTIFKATHTVPALEDLRARQQIETTPHQKRIHHQTGRTTRITARPAHDDLFGSWSAG
ncbi:MAG: three-Cys-motif partner protein TcmP [Pseudonocardiaceae bacterium]